MNIEIHQPELENLIQQRMKSGGFQSAEDFLMHMLIPTKSRDMTKSKDEPSGAVRDIILEKPAPSEADPHRHISDVILDIMSDVPRESFESLPRDGASEHDHYLYGSPKKNQ